MQNYLKLLRFLKKHKVLFAWAVAAMFIASFFESIQLSMLVPLTDRIFNKRLIQPPNHLPAFLNNIVNNLNATDPKELFALLPFVVFVLFLLKNLVTYFYQLLMNDVSQRVMRDVRYRVYETIQNLSLDYFGEKRTGELISRVTHDVPIIENAVSYGVTDLFRQSFLIIFYVGIAFTIHIKAALIAFFVFPCIGFPIANIGKKLRKLSQMSQERMADINTILLETISGIRVVKAFCTEKQELDRFKEKSHDYYKLKMKSVRRTLFIPLITEMVGVIGGIFVMVWLGRQVMKDTMSFGVFALFFGSIMSIISPMKKLANVNAITQQALAANQRIYDILEQLPTVKEKPNAAELPLIRENVSLENITFQYDNESGDILKDINLEIQVGQLVAIVGPTGTGKSTLVNLIPRFYDPTQGVIRIDGIDLREVSFKSLRKQIGIVAQENFLFNDTVKANIAYGHPQATQAEVESAARKAYAHQFIANMPNGYETIIGDRGFRLSGGEKQRIAIARAILKNPPMLILDEATSQLDSESEKYVQDALDKLMEGRTVIAIAHRLSTITKADKIVVIDRGRIVGMDKHDGLLKSCDLYQRLYKTQFQL